MIFESTLGVVSLDGDAALVLRRHEGLTVIEVVASGPAPRQVIALGRQQREALSRLLMAEDPLDDA